MNIFVEMVHSVLRPRSYAGFLNDKKGKTFLYGFVLVLIYFFITIMVPFISFQLSTGGIVNLADEFVPDFTIENRTVHVSRPVKLEEGGMYVLVDTDSTFIGGSGDSDADAALEAYDRVLLMDSKQAVFKSNGQIQQIAYEDLDGDLFMTKEIMLDSLRSVVNMILVAGAVFILAGMELLFFLGVVFVALFGMVVASCMKCRLAFGQLYKLGVYARTAPLLLKALLSFMPFGIPMFFVISICISLCYIGAGIRYMEAPGTAGGAGGF